MKNLILFIIALFIAGCAPVKFYDSDHNWKHNPVTSDSLVKTMHAVVEMDEDGVVPKRIRLIEWCHAFVADFAGSTKLVTATHCINSSMTGDTFLYEKYNGIGTSVATVDRVYNDVVIATVYDRSLVPLKIDPHYDPQIGDVAVNVSYSGVSTGKIIGSLGDNWYDTTTTTFRGHSGSPMFNRFGYVWGVMSACTKAIDKSDCNHGYAIVSGIY